MSVADGHDRAVRSGLRRTHILWYEPRDQDEGRLGVAQNVGVAQEVTVHQTSRQAQVLGPRPVHLPHHPRRDFSVHVVKECLAAVEDLG